MNDVLGCVTEATVSTPRSECRIALEHAADVALATSALDRLRPALADRYRLERELGAGGMATGYLAHDLKHDRDVAIKVLRPVHSTEGLNQLTKSDALANLEP